MVEAMIEMIGVVTGSLVQFFSNIMPGYVVFVFILFISMLPLSIGKMIKKFIEGTYDE